MTMTRSQQLIAAGVLVALLAAYFGYSAYRERALSREVTGLVTDTATRLGKALEVRDALSAPDATAVQAQLEEHLAAAERNLKTLRALDAARVRALADTADEYLNTSVEILRRKTASHGHRLQLALSLQALREHMAGDRRAKEWVPEAIRAKERMDSDFRDYRRSTEALAQLLDGYAISRRRMSERMDPAPLPEDGAAEAARSHALDTVKRVAEEVEQAGRLDAYR